jgi:TATA-binding protein-associated factor Taf7
MDPEEDEQQEEENNKFDDESSDEEDDDDDDEYNNEDKDQIERQKQIRMRSKLKQSLAKERKQLGKLLMTRKQRRIYAKFNYSLKRKKAFIRKLQEKRMKIDRLHGQQPQNM